MRGSLLISSGLELNFNGKSFAKQNSLKNVRFHNPVDKSEIARLQCESDILVAAITDSDSYKFGLNLNKLGGYLGPDVPLYSQAILRTIRSQILDRGLQFPPAMRRA